MTYSSNITNKTTVLAPKTCAIKNNNRNCKNGDSPRSDVQTATNNPSRVSATSHAIKNDTSVTTLTDSISDTQSAQKPVNSVIDSVNSCSKESIISTTTKPSENQRNPKFTRSNNQPFFSQPQWNQNNSNQLTPREGTLKPPLNQGSKRQIGGKSVWKGKPVIYDCDRSSRSPLPHSVPENMDESLIFESRFESGNLRQVRRMLVV